MKNNLLKAAIPLLALACGSAFASPYLMRVPLKGIVASGSGTAQSGTLTLSVPSVAFGNVETGQSVTSAAISLTNGSASAATGVSITPPANYSVVSNTCGSTLAANSSCAFSVKFAPTAVQAYNSSIAVSSSFGSNSLAVTGAGTAPSNTTSAATLAFGTVAVNSSQVQSVTLTNTSDGPLNNINIYTGTSYYVAATNCGTSLPKGQACTINVTFTPTATTSYPDTLTIASDAATKTVSLSGSGVSGNSDPYFSSVTMLLHMDGLSGSTTITDVKGTTINNSTNTMLSSGAAKFGTAGLSSGGTSKVSFQNSASINTYTGDYTEEFWLYLTNNSSAQAILDSWGSSAGHSFWISSGSLTYYYNGGSKILVGVPISAGQWHHVAATRASGTIRLFIDGVLQNNTVVGVSGTLSPGQTITGINYEPSGNTGVIGYLDEVRITNGVARYTSSFTPPTAAFPDN